MRIITRKTPIEREKFHDDPKLLIDGGVKAVASRSRLMHCLNVRY
jgi:hypothetical protein